jgi:uncharacterized protein YdeI (BOF family)
MREDIMNKLLKYVVFVFLLTPVPVLAQQSSKQKSADGKEAGTAAWKAFRMRERFQGPLSLKTKAGKALALNVGLRIWSIDGTLGRQTLRTTDYTVFRLRAGKIKTVIDGKEQVRNVDEYWTLPAGSTLSLEVKGETALLETTTIATK